MIDTDWPVFEAINSKLIEIGASNIPPYSRSIVFPIIEIELSFLKYWRILSSRVSNIYGHNDK